MDALILNIVPENKLLIVRDIGKNNKNFANPF